MIRLLRFALLAPLITAGAGLATAAPGALIVKSFVTDAPALGRFASPQSLCSEAQPEAPRAATGSRARAHQMVLVDCPRFFTRAAAVPSRPPAPEAVFAPVGATTN